MGLSEGAGISLGVAAGGGGEIPGLVAGCGASPSASCAAVGRLVSSAGVRKASVGLEGMVEGEGSLRMAGGLTGSGARSSFPLLPQEVKAAVRPVRRREAVRCFIQWDRVVWGTDRRVVVGWQ